MLLHGESLFYVFCPDGAAKEQWLMALLRATQPNTAASAAQRLYAQYIAQLRLQSPVGIYPQVWLEPMCTVRLQCPLRRATATPTPTLPPLLSPPAAPGAALQGAGAGAGASSGEGGAMREGGGPLRQGGPLARPLEPLVRCSLS